MYSKEAAVSITISVIIPVYNVEKYLHRCVESILQQTFQDFEIILVDDGSRDNSGEICDEYAKKDTRIKVIHKNNARVSAARNDGMKIANGKYISFIDSDDWIEPEMYQNMIKKAEELNLDFIMCDYIKRSPGYEDKRTQPIRGGYYSKDDIKKELFSCLIMFENVEFPPTISNWVCLFNLEFLKKNNITYDEDVYYAEDSIFGSKVMYNANNFYYFKKHYYYNYFFNPNSTTNTYDKEKWDEKWDSYIKINNKLGDYFSKNTEYDFSRQIRINMLYFTLRAIGEIEHYDISHNHKIKMIRLTMNHPKVRDIFQKFKLPKVTWKHTVVFIIIKYKLAYINNLLFLRK